MNNRLRHSSFVIHPSSFIFLLLLAAGLVFTSPSYGLMLGLGTGDLVREAEAVVVGRVTDVQSYWTADGKKIITRASVEVSSVVVGVVGARIQVEVEGGRVGDIGMRVSDTPSFSRDEKVLLFLRSGRPAGLRGAAPVDEVFTVAGLAQGKYTITPEGAAVKTGFAVVGERDMIENNLPLADMLQRIVKEAEAAGKIKP